LFTGEQKRGNFKRVYYLYTEKELANFLNKVKLRMVSWGFTGYLKTKAATYICNKAPIAEKEYLRAKDSN
jgi:hypothetical protein